jgi:hypothetical protein
VLRNAMRDAEHQKNPLTRDRSLEGAVKFERLDEAVRELPS